MTQTTDQLNQIVALRMSRERVNSGELHIALIWNDIADLDLHVITPSNEHIYYGQKESSCGGWLDVDMNRGSEASLEPIENVFWALSPSGHYKVYVHNFSNKTSNATVFTDANRRVPFRVRLIRGVAPNSTTEWFEGTVGPHENITCFEFDNVGTGAVGPYVVIPPNDVDATFEELCRKNNVTYTAGNGYYALKKTEKISAKKDMILHDNDTDTFIIGSDNCRRILGLPLSTDISIKPIDIPTKYKLFVQSTSHNRKIPKNTHVLFKVHIREALQHRMSNRYTFN
jgi:hypothetical protein